MAVSKEDKIVRGSDLATIGTQVKAKLAEKQDKLVSGTNIKTVNGTSLLGSGNITVEDGKSAYQIWLDEGHAGTEADFLASLQGNSGYSGAAGELEVVNNTTQGGATAALSAEMGKVLDGKVGQLGQESIKFTIDDVSDTENIRENIWIRYTDGMRQVASSAGLWTTRFYPCHNIDKIYCKVGSDGPSPASVSFYKEKPRFEQGDIGRYLGQEFAVQAMAGVHEYLVDVPDGATWVCVSNRGLNLSVPVVKLYWQKRIERFIADYDSTLLYQSKNVIGSSFSQNFDISSIEDGAQLELEITELSGSTAASIALYTDTDGTRRVYNKSNLAVGKYYFEKVSGLSIVRVEKLGTEGNLVNWKLRTITSHYPVQNRAFSPFLPAKQVNTIDLGKPFVGYYSIVANQDSENIIAVVNYWVSWPIQKTNGFIINIEFDASQYYVNFSSFDETYQRRAEFGITSSPYQIDLGSCRGWNLALRKTNYGAISPADADGLLTVTRVSGTIFEKPLLKYEVKKVVDDEIVERIGETSIPTVAKIAKEGYGLNPFVEKPFYYHFKANGFIVDQQGHKTIASESLDDVELAARLGFGFIEANIQPTSDGHFVVIHGTSGTFGPECKSINPSVISTADLQATAISSVTLEWIKANVRYDSDYEKYQTSIPSIEEFCSACKIHNIGIFAGTSSRNAIDTCVKYLGQNVIIYNSPSDIRTYFNGWCFIWNNAAATTVEQILAACRSKVAPVMYGLGPTLAAQLYADGNMDTLIKSMHDEGFLIGWTANYDSEENGRKYHKLGMDFSSSENDINPFVANYEVFDVDSDNLPTTTGTIADGIIMLASGNTLTCGSSSKIIGKAWLSIQFNGTLTINFGSKGSSGRTITSDGSEEIVITDYIFMRGTTLTITAGDVTTVTRFLYKTSKC